jgi:hypothetical protein
MSLTEDGGQKDENLIGQRFGHLVITAILPRDQKSYRRVKCLCDCGRTSDNVALKDLRSGSPRSCGCRNGKNLIGMTFGHLVVIDYGSTPGKWLCLCDCGEKKEIKFTRLFGQNGPLIKSCGCKMHKTQNGLNPAFNLLYSDYRKSAPKRGYSFGLSTEEFMDLTSRNCYFCNRPPSTIRWTPDKKSYYRYNGIDRIDNSKDYLWDNCVPCCKECNCLKCAVTMDMARKMVEFQPLEREIFGLKDPLEETPDESSLDFA